VFSDHNIGLQSHIKKKHVDKAMPLDPRYQCLIGPQLLQFYLALIGILGLRSRP